MRPWYRYAEKYDDRPRPMLITPFSRVWGYGANVTLALVIANAAIWLVMTVTAGAKWLPLYEWWYRNFAMTPRLVVGGRVYQLVTSIFLHDGLNILHLVFNMYLLWVFGPRVERTFTSARFLAFYIVCGIVGNILSLGLRWIGGGFDTPSLGASAAVFGIVVAYGFLFYNEIILLFFVIPVKVWKAVVGFIVLETLFVLFRMQVDVDHWAHLGGAMAAAVWMLVMIRQTGHKTAHGWYHTSRGRPQAGRSASRGPFRIIITPRPTEREDYPEGKDDEPPPDWFKL